MCPVVEYGAGSAATGFEVLSAVGAVDVACVVGTVRPGLSG